MARLAILDDNGKVIPGQWPDEVLKAVAAAQQVASDAEAAAQSAQAAATAAAAAAAAAQEAVRQAMGGLTFKRQATAPPADPNTIWIKPVTG